MLVILTAIVWELIRTLSSNKMDLKETEKKGKGEGNKAYYKMEVKER